MYTSQWHCGFQAVKDVYKRQVDANDLNLRMIDAGAENHAADAAKTIDTNFDAHSEKLLSNS